MKDYIGRTPDSKLDELIDKVKDKMDSDVSENNQIRPEGESFLTFVRRGTKALQMNTEALDIIQAMKDGSV